MDAKRLSRRVLEVVQVTWVDSEAIGEWSSLKDMSHEVEEVVTVGMLIHQDEKCYLISSTYDGATDSINAAIWIPRAAVVEVRPIGAVSVRVN